MKNFKLIIEYDGTKYSGWQKQGNTKNTIYEKFSDILFKLIGKEVEIFASGRTDAGVHAKGQVINFKCETDFDEKQMLSYINNYLPEDIKVLSCEIKDERFHSRLNAKTKTYMYRIYKGKPSVFDRKYVYPIDFDVDTDKMREASKFFEGTHDFKSFCTKQRMKKSTVRTIYSINIEEKDNEIRIVVEGNGFLYNMVRILAGTLLNVGEGSIKIQDLQGILDSKNRENAGVTLPAKGLVLLKVEY